MREQHIKLTRSYFMEYCAKKNNLFLLEKNGKVKFLFLFKSRITFSDECDLFVQLDIFDEQRLADECQLTGPSGVDLSSHQDIFYAILRQVNVLIANIITALFYFVIAFNFSN